jgi:endonuclease YncB( thermonuclease family)
MRALTLTLLLAAFLALPPTALAVRTGGCLPGQSHPVCDIWTGKVTFVGDGDTVYVDVDGDGTHRTKRVRLTGINAQEQTVYAAKPRDRRGECHALEATAYLDRMIKKSHKRVRLLAQDPASHSGSRPRRSLQVKLHGRWQDTGRRLLAHGDALWLPNAVEYAWNGEYSRIAERTAARRIGIWNPSYCGGGYPANLRVWVSWDAEGSDFKNLNGEWIRIKNLDAAPVNLGGWVARTSDLRRFHIPAGTVVPPGGSLTVHVGSGANTATDLYWGLRGPVFDQATDDDRKLGDGGYLFDPRGNLRGQMMYPCRWNCADPLQGKLDVRAFPRRSDEYVAVSNTSTTAVDLEGYQLDSRWHFYDFGPGTVLQPGDTLRLYVRGSPDEDTALVKHWGFDASVLPNGGDAVAIRTFSDIVLSCYSWGDGSCSAGAGA